jgi:cytochrome P450
MYSPVQFLARQTTSSTALVYNNIPYSLPQETYIELAISSVHYSPSYYGPTAACFDPSRWDRNNASSYLAQNDSTPDLTAMGLGDKRLHRPVRGAFVGFSDGNRACIGTKFAMVEFVGVLVQLLKNHRVEVKVLKGEDREGARRRAQVALDGSLGPFSLTPSGTVPLVMRRRK